MKKILFSLTYLLCSFVNFAQNNAENEFLPHYPTVKEILLQKEIAPFVEETASFPLPKNVRTMAEWEELQGLQIAWQGTTAHKNILAEIVKAAREECTVYVYVNDSTTLKSCKTTLLNKNIDVTSNVTFLVKPTDSIWIRDYGGNPVYSNNVDTLGIVDWIYNRPSRKLDDASPVAIADFLKIPIYKTNSKPDDLVHTGGNFMSDGLGTAFSSELIWAENALNNPNSASVKTKGQIDSIMMKYMGISRYIKMTTLPNDVIHHIDMHIKLLDEETLIVSKYPDGVSDGPQIEANLQYVLANFKTPYGKPYKVVRIIAPPDASNLYPNAQSSSQNGQYRTYSNMTFVNKTVLVPYYDLKYDSIAEKTLKAALPGYKIVGINCNSIIGSLGAIHCITKELGVADPLWITHEKKLDDLAYTGGNIPVSARIEHRLGVKNAKIWYKKSDETAFQSFDLSKIATSNIWAADFPKLDNDNTYNYYVEAEANSGKKIRRPITAPAGYYSFKLGNPNVGTKDLSESNLKIYPNPAKAITCIEFENNDNIIQAEVVLVDIFGKSIANVFKGSISSGTNRFFIDASEYQTGIYFAKIKTNIGERTEKIMIVR